MAATKRTPPPPDQTVHHESARKKRRGGAGGNMSVNMTPMIDVTFLLLIFFVVATNFARQEGALASKLPDLSPQGTPPPIPPLKLEVVEESAGNAYVLVNGHRKSLNELTPFLVGISSDGSTYNPDTTTVVMEPHKNVAWKYVLAAYNNTLRAGYKEINWSGK